MFEEIQKYIKEEILALFKLILETDQYGVNNKVGKNTLADSDLHRTANIQSDKIEEYNLFYNDYLDYIESGRKPFARKVPVDALVRWAKRKGIPDDSSTIYAIRESIYQKGIKARPIIEHFERELDELFDSTLSDRIFTTITSQLDRIFNSNQ